MWNLFDLAYDIAYFIYKSADTLKWDALLIYIIYAVGKRSGMKMFRKFLAEHFPALADENEDWRKWATKQIESLGGAKWQPTKQYGRTKRSRKLVQTNSNISSSLLQEGESPERRYEMKTIVIDAGHGGTDSGAVGATSKLEKDFNLSMALKVQALLKDNPNLKVILTRSTDIFIELSGRAKIANNAKADAFLSIHANASSTTTGTGSETLYTKDADIPLATIIHKHLIAATGLTDRKCKYQNLSVCRNTTMPAALIEPGFVSNPTEEATLFDTTFQNTLAEAMARALCEYVGVSFTVGAYPEIDIVFPSDNDGCNGFIASSRSWVPARTVLEYVGANWTYSSKKVYINGTAIETMIVNSTSYIKPSDLQSLGVARVFFSNESPKQVLIYKPL